MPISQCLEDNHYISTKLSYDGHHKRYKVNDYYCARQLGYFEKQAYFKKPYKSSK